MTEGNEMGLRAPPVSSKTPREKNLKVLTTAFSSSIFFSVVVSSCQLYPKIKMDRKMEASETGRNRNYSKMQGKKKQTKQIIIIIKKKQQREGKEICAGLH